MRKKTGSRLDHELRRQVESMSTMCAAHDWSGAIALARAHPAVTRGRMSGKDPMAKMFLGMPFLNFAVGRADTDVLGTLLDLGCPIEGRAPGGCTPLLNAIYMAARDRRAAEAAEEAALLLISRGARCDAVDDSGLSPIYMAGGYLQPQVLEALLAAGTPLDGLASPNSEPMPALTWLVSNAIGYTTPLPTATLTRLLREDVDLNPRVTKVCQTPLGALLNYGDQGLNLELADAMVRHGADVRIRSNDGQTVLHIAATARAAQWILGLAPDLLDARDRQGRTPLMHLLELGDWTNPLWRETVASLVAAGADLEAVDRQGPSLCMTPAQRIEAGPAPALVAAMRSVQARRAAQEALGHQEPACRL